MHTDTMKLGHCGITGRCHLPIPLPGPTSPVPVSQWLQDEMLFNNFDRNNDGQISRDELLMSGKRNSLTYRGYDTNNDGQISKAEWHTARQRDREFRAKDANRDGQITIDEYTAGLTGDALIQATREFYRLDADRSGSISRAEYLKGGQWPSLIDLLKGQGPIMLEAPVPPRLSPATHQTGAVVAAAR